MKRPHFHITLTQTFQYFHMLIQFQKYNNNDSIYNHQKRSEFKHKFNRWYFHQKHISKNNWLKLSNKTIYYHKFTKLIGNISHCISIWIHTRTHIHNQNKPHQRINQWTQFYLKISIRIQTHPQITLVTRLKLQNTKPWVHLLDGHYPGNLPQRYVSKPGRANNQ